MLRSEVKRRVASLVFELISICFRVKQKFHRVNMPPHRGSLERCFSIIVTNVNSRSCMHQELQNTGEPPVRCLIHSSLSIMVSAVQVHLILQKELYYIITIFPCSID